MTKKHFITCIHACPLGHKMILLSFIYARHPGENNTSLFSAFFTWGGYGETVYDSKSAMAGSMWSWKKGCARHSSAEKRLSGSSVSIEVRSSSAVLSTLDKQVKIHF